MSAEIRVSNAAWRGEGGGGVTRAVLTAGKKRNKAGVRGGQGGKMAPGEKGKLKRAWVLAKRAARAETRGFDYGRMNVQLAEFVASGGDMMVRFHNEQRPRAPRVSAHKFEQRLYSMICICTRQSLQH